MQTNEIRIESTNRGESAPALCSHNVGMSEAFDWAGLANARDMEGGVEATAPRHDKGTRVQVFVEPESGCCTGPHTLRARIWQGVEERYALTAPLELLTLFLGQVRELIDQMESEIARDRLLSDADRQEVVPGSIGEAAMAALREVGLNPCWVEIGDLHPAVRAPDGTLYALHNGCEEPYGVGIGQPHQWTICAYPPAFLGADDEAACEACDSDFYEVYEGAVCEDEAQAREEVRAMAREMRRHVDRAHSRIRGI